MPNLQRPCLKTNPPPKAFIDRQNVRHERTLQAAGRGVAGAQRQVYVADLRLARI